MMPMKAQMLVITIGATHSETILQAQRTRRKVFSGEIKRKRWTMRSRNFFSSNEYHMTDMSHAAVRPWASIARIR